MGTTIQITALDGNTFNAYRADPEASPKGAVVVVQEIFGVNGHIRSVVDGYAEKGYVAIAPALFDRVERELNSVMTNQVLTLGGKLRLKT